MVGVALQGERRGGVSCERPQVAYGLAALGEQGEARVPEVVEADGEEAGPREQRLEVPVYDVLRLDGAAARRREHEAVLAPRRAGLDLLSSS